jgi:hypothetical protein
MDPIRFDRLARQIASPSRRALLGTLGLSGLALLLGQDPPAATAKPKKKPCKSTQKKCGTKCIPKANCCTNKDCTAPKTCQNGTCRCTPKCSGKSCGASDGCGGKCVTNQGCGSGQTCSPAGQCVDTACGNGLHACGAAGCQQCCAGQLGADDQCCPPQTPNCLERDGNRARSCLAPGVCTCPAQYPYFWAAFGGSPQCYECQQDGDCALPPNGVALVQGRLHCFFGNCVCPDERPTLCRVFGQGGLQCTNIGSDPTNCGDCTRVCNLQLGQTCVGGVCTNPGSA